MDLIQVLEKTVSPDKNELFVAKNFLEEASATNLPEFLKALSDVLVNTGNSAVARTAAGLQLKNHLTSKDAAINKEYQYRWLQFPNDTREYIKKNILQSLGTENTRPSSAAQCVAYVAVVELPANQWNYLIQTLVNKVVNDSCSEMERESALEAIGYICQDIGAEVLENQSNQILTAIVHGMRKTETNVHCRLAATTALLNSLEFTKPNFEKQAERNYIMEVVCESTQNSDPQICVTALQCLVKILSLYYQYMEPYMAQALFPITLEAMKSDSDPVALQGIEFWSNVCDEEFDLSIENQEASDLGRLPERVSKHYARGALQYLAPVLMDKLTKQEELDDEDDWNPAKAASVCLMLLASCCEDEVIPHVLPFIKANIQSDNWRYRDAALMVFGSILGGLDSNTLKPLVEQAMPTLIKLMYDSSVSVRDTTAWTFGRICEIIPETAINPDNLKPLLESFLFGLKAEPRVAANVCWAFSGLAEAAYEAADTSGLETANTYCLSPYFEFIVQLLLETTDRSDGAIGNLRGAAYEALMEMIKNSPQDCYLVVQKTTMVILERLNRVLQLDNQITCGYPPLSDRTQIVDIQSLLAATLQSVLRKILPEDAPKISDSIMQALLTMFEGASGKYGCVQEDALMAVSTLIDLMGEKFDKYMPAFKPYLFKGLRTVDVHQVCTTAVGVTSDLCRGLKHKILPYCSEIMQLLLENLSNPNLDRVVKPHILPVFADMALSIGVEFSYYLAPVMDMLRHASELQIDRNDFEMIDYLQELRNSVMEAYTGILQGLTGLEATPYVQVNLLEPYLPNIISFLTAMSQDTELSEANICSACGLIGDLVEAFSYKIIRMIDTEHTQRLINEGKKSRILRTRNLALWAQKIIRKARDESNEQHVDGTLRCIKTNNQRSNMCK